MDFTTRREELVKELQDLTSRMLQYQGAIAMIDEILAKEAAAKDADSTKEGEQ